MKPPQFALFAVFLIGICNIIPSVQTTEESCPGQLHSEDSCSGVDTPKPLPLAHVCLTTTFNGKKDSRSPVVIVPGFNAFKELYMGLAQHLSLKTSRKVCIIDNRNHGDSPWSDETDTKAMAEDLAHFMKTIDADKIVVLGHSMGGKIAVEFASTYPDKVEKIVVEDMRPNGMSEEAQQIFGADMDWFRNAFKVIPEGVSEYEAKKTIVNFYKLMYERVGERLDYDESMIDYIPIKCADIGCAWKPNIDVLEKIFKDPSKFWHDSSGEFDKPALFIYGEKSIFKVGDAKEDILRLFPKAKLHEMKDRRHCLNAYPEFRKEVTNFINAHD